MALAKFEKDPDAVLDYTVDWAPYLGGDTISAVEWIVPEGLTLDTQEEDDTTATAWLSGGTAGEDYEVVCRVTTVGGRIDDRTIVIRVREQ